MMKSLVSLLLVVLLSTVAASLGGNGVVLTNKIAAGRKNTGIGGGRSNNRKLQNETELPTYSPTGEGGDDDEDGSSEEGDTIIATTTSATVTTVASKNTEDNDEVVATPPAMPNDENESAPTAPINTNAGKTCSFCEEGIPYPELVVEDADGKTCAEVKAIANACLEKDSNCPEVIQPIESVCCPQVVPSSGGSGVPPAVAEGSEGDDIEYVTVPTPPDFGGDEDNDLEAPPGEGDGGPDVNVPTTAKPESVGDSANDFVGGGQDSTENTTTAVEPTSAAAESNTSATEAAATDQSLEACIQSAQYAGKEDPLFTCCVAYPNEAICALNSCMDFESQVITCQCKEVKGIAKSILSNNDPMADYLPEDFEDFLGTFHKCCPNGAISPGEFNDCYYDEISEEIMEEIEEEFEELPTQKPTPRPTSSVYIPMSDDEDPISKEGAEDFSNGQKDDSLQGMINTYLDGVESPDEMKSDKNVQVVAISLVAVFLVLMLVTAHLVMDYPDGLCASFCRLILKCLCCIIRVLCLPCRAICCKGSDQTRSRRTHAPMRAPFPSDLELA